MIEQRREGLLWLAGSRHISLFGNSFVVQDLGQQKVILTPLRNTGYLCDSRHCLHSKASTFWRDHGLVSTACRYRRRCWRYERRTEEADLAHAALPVESHVGSE